MRPLILTMATVFLLALAGDSVSRAVDQPPVPELTVPDSNASSMSERRSPLPVLRPITAVDLSQAVRPSIADHPLPEPENQAGELLKRHLPEEHYTLAPWQRSRASRNQFRIRYQPLYFEDPNFERCGQSAGCLTEFVSAAHFGARIPLLPYMMANQPPRYCVDALPDCPTCEEFGPDAYFPPPSHEAIVFQAACTIGWLAIFP